MITIVEVVYIDRFSHSVLRESFSAGLGTECLLC